MSTIRLIRRTVAVAIAMFALGFIGHQLLLGRDYVSIEPIMRSKQDMQAHMPFALISACASLRLWCGFIRRRA